MAFVAKVECSKNKVSKVVDDDSNSNSTDEEFTSEIRSLMFSNTNKLFKKNFSIFKGNKFNRGYNKGKNFKSKFK